jgi:hypothetical protein
MTSHTSRSRRSGRLASRQGKNAMLVVDPAPPPVVMAQNELDIGGATYV